MSHFLEQTLDLLTEASAPVKLFVFFGIWLLCWIPVALPLALILQWHPFRTATLPAQKIPLVSSLYAIAPIVIWGASILESTPWTAYGVFWNVKTLRSVGMGFSLGVIGLAGLFAVQWGLGWLQVQFKDQPLISTTSLAATPSTTAPEPSVGQKAAKLVPMLLATLGIAIWISAIEELVFRGFLPNQLQQDYAIWVAVSLSSLIFALLHLVWEGRENIPQLPGLWLMGIVLSIACWVDQGSLGLAVGLHAGWIWTIASMDAAQLISFTGKAPKWLTGLNDQPLAGAAGFLFLLLTAVVLLEIRVLSQIHL